MKIGNRVLDLWLDMFLGPSDPNVVLGPRPPSYRIFWDIMILLDSCYASGENEVLFVKIGARILALWLDKSLPKGFRPKLP